MKLKKLEKKLIDRLDDGLEYLDQSEYPEDDIREIVDQTVPDRYDDILKLFYNDWRDIAEYEEDAHDMCDGTLFSYLMIMIFLYLESEVAHPWARKNDLL